MKIVGLRLLLRLETLLLVFSGWVLRRRTKSRSGVLLLRWDRIGDAVLWLPYAKGLITSEEAGGEKVTLLCADSMADFYHQMFPSVEILAFGVKDTLTNLSYRRSLLKKIRTRKFAILYNPRSVREFLIDDAIAAAAACPKSHAIICPEREVNPRWQRWSRCCYTDLIPISDKASEWESAIAFYMGTGKWTPVNADIYQRLHHMQQHPIMTNYIVILPGSCDPFRCWPQKNYRKLVLAIRKKYPRMTVVIAGNTGEGFLTQNGEIDLTGKTTLREFIGLLAGAKCVIGNESGGIHLAAALGVPNYCFAGFGHWGRFIPYPKPYIFVNVCPPVLLTAAPCSYAPCNWQCHYFSATSQRCPCIDNIPLETINKIEIEKTE